ncbi:MAG TPA: septum formation initiator family protein [Chitinophagaceae bacterium]|nr:septum formation initiator family protein [Chitinophagaceae bacterium]
MQLIGRIPSWLRNKYVLAVLAFGAWILFFDRNDLITQWQRRQELIELQRSKNFYSAQIRSESQELDQLKTNPAALEKYAREKYYMKRDNEELFLLPGDAKKGPKTPVAIQ